MADLVFSTVSSAHLLAGPAQERSTVNRDYLMSLTNLNLLRPYLFEAGLWQWSSTANTTVGNAAADGPDTWHWGWEAPTSQLRGHILGHWLSAAAHLSPHDLEVKAKAHFLVGELRRCQLANGEGWIGPFAPSYLLRAQAGKKVWAPQYTVHKLLMGLWDMYAIAGHQLAYEILTDAAGWFHTWTSDMDTKTLDDILDYETGGMLEIWADLLGETGESMYLELVGRYDRRRFFDSLLAGEDCLTNRHANTQIVEVLGAARAYEVTGDKRWRQIVEAFWNLAIQERGTYATGGSTSAEVWQPRRDTRGRLHSVQEHCTVYNLMRLAEVLYRWTGERLYADYWETNLLNGLWAQQNARTGMVAYFLPLEIGSIKRWGRPTEDFWCCHGTCMQAHTRTATSVVQQDDKGLRISQFIPSVTTLELSSGAQVQVRLTQDALRGVTFGQTSTPAGLEAIQRVDNFVPSHRPRCLAYHVDVSADRPVSFRLRIRLPAWLRSSAVIDVAGERYEIEPAQEWFDLERDWSTATIRCEFPLDLRMESQDGDASRVAFFEGPHLLAALTEGDAEVTEDVEQALIADQERIHSWWAAGRYRLRSHREIRLIPLSEVDDEVYTVYCDARTSRIRDARL